MPRPVRASTLVTPILALAIAGCDGSVSWLVQPGKEATAAQPPFDLGTGGFLVAGTSYRSPDAGDSYPILALLSEDGEAVETNSPPLAQMRLEPAADGRFAFAGRAEGDDAVDQIGLMNEKGKIVASRQVDGASFAHESPGVGYYVAGAVAGASPEDVFVKKVDPYGNELWAYHRNQFLYNRVFDAVFRPDGSVVIAGPTGDTFPMTGSYITQVNEYGQEAWTLLVFNTSILAIDEDRDTGTIYATGSAGNDVLIGAVDSHGEKVFWNTFDGSSHDNTLAFESGWSVSVNRKVDASHAEVLVGGTFADEIDFGLGEPLKGSDDAFLVAMNVGGDPLWQMSASSDGSDIFRARYTSDGDILASLYCSTGGYSNAEREAHVGGRSFKLRGIIDSAVMKIAR